MQVSKTVIKPTQCNTMLALALTFLLIACVLTEYPELPNDVVPNYIKKALREKNKYIPMTRAKTRTIHNLTMKEVIDHIKDITRALNYNAKKNGYKVDYNFRVVDNFFQDAM